MEGFAGVFVMTEIQSGKTGLSVIIVTWYSQEEIGPCLASIPNRLAGRPVEIVVVDNSLNADGTGDLIRDLYPDVDTYIPERNLGFGSGNNLGIRRSRGDCILVLNPDTVCNRVALEHCLTRIQDEPEIGLISPRLVKEDGSMDLACRRKIPNLWDGFCRASGLAGRFPRSRLCAGYNLTYLDDEETYDVGAINGAFMMGRRTVFEEVGLFDEDFFMYGDDLDLCYRFAAAGYRVVYDGRVSITHLKGTSVARDYDRMSEAIFDANKAFYLKHFNRKDRFLVRLKYGLAFGLWKWVARFRAGFRGHRRVRPL
ncbi:MAG: glycosyltransferase family 2 protein [Verrucomicrobia bacterium]|nr:MAG: glycosyltransferase family 2 protein [Verrucomicrobiota bacterium]